jgi:hypothetical protein
MHDEDCPGPVVPVGHEVIDHGVVVYVTCETCGMRGDTAFDLDDVNWEES